MSEARSIQYSPWTAVEGQRQVNCIKCQTKGNAYRGVLQQRHITDRNGEMHREYKVVCPFCNRSTEAHRSQLVSVLEWEGKQKPGDGLRYRTRKTTE